MTSSDGFDLTKIFLNERPIAQLGEMGVASGCD